MKINVRDYTLANLKEPMRVIKCSGFRAYHMDQYFMRKMFEIIAEHFSNYKTSIEIILYNNEILKDDETDTSIVTFRNIATQFRDMLLESGVHPEAMEFDFVEWTFPKGRKHKDTKIKMANRILIHNHKVMRVPIVDKMTVNENTGKLMRDKYPMFGSLPTGLYDTASDLYLNTVIPLVHDIETMSDDDSFKMIQAISLMEYATDLLKGLITTKDK